MFIYCKYQCIEYVKTKTGHNLEINIMHSIGFVLACTVFLYYDVVTYLYRLYMIWYIVKCYFLTFFL